MTSPSTSPTPDWETLGRYLAGESSPDEAAAVRRWLDEHPSDARVIAALDAATKNLSPAGEGGRDVDVEAALRRVKTRAKRTVRRWYVGVAAAAAVALFALLLGRTRGDQTPTDAQAYATATGGRDTVFLGDGSHIIMAPSTRLVVTERDVELAGEAFFSIVHDEARPYTVRANGVVIRDIGTEFGVQGYPGDPVRVFVTKGAVELARGDQRVMLDSGDVGVVEPGGRVSRAAGAATPDDVAWTEGRLVFRDASVAELGADLRRWYGVELRVTDSALLRRHFTGSFAGEPASRVTDVIALALGARAERRGDTVFLRAAPPRR